MSVQNLSLLIVHSCAYIHVINTNLHVLAGSYNAQMLSAFVAVCLMRPETKLGSSSTVPWYRNKKQEDIPARLLGSDAWIEVISTGTAVNPQIGWVGS